MRHITVTIHVPPIEEKSYEDEEDEDETEERQDTKHNPEPDNAQLGDAQLGDAQLVVKKQITPLGNGRKRPRKAKRMKIEAPALDSISEDSNTALSTPRSVTEKSDSPLRDTKNLEESYHSLLADISQSHEAMLLQKRQTVALLKQTNYGIQTHKQKQQMSLASYAKKKLRKLPPISDSKATFRYSHHQQISDMSHMRQLSIK